MSEYPTSKDNLKVDTSGTDPMSAHAELHNDANEAINAIQDFIGTSDNDGGTTIVDGINIIANQIDGLGDSLGVDIDIDGNVTINPDKPSIIVPESDDSKFDVGAGTENLNDATQMEAAIVDNADNIESLIAGLGGTVNPDGSIDIDIDVDGLPDQSGQGGKFLTTDGSDASWGDVAVDSYDDTELIKRLESDEGILEDHEKRIEAEENHTHADLAAGDHTHDDLAADDHTHDIADVPHDHDGTYQPVGEYATKTELSDGLAGKSDDDHTHADLATEDHTHDPDDTKLDKGATTYLDAKAIEDDISGIEESISNLADNYDQIVIDLGEAGEGLTVELESYLKKGTASYADAAGIETDIDQEKTDRAEGDKALSEEVAKKLDKGTSTYADAKDIQDAIEGIVVPDVSGFVTTDDMNTALSGKADEPHTHADLAAGDHNHDGDYATGDHTHDDLAAGDHNHDGDYATGDHTHDEYLTDLTHDHDGTYQPAGDYATTEELTEGLAGKADDLHTHDTTHNHEEYFLAGAEVDEFGQPIPLPYANAKLLGDEVDTKADEGHTHDDSVSFEVNGDLFCNNIVTLTQAEYDALSDRDPHTLYLAVDA